MWQKLASILASLIKHYQELAELNKQKRGILVMVKMKELEALTKQENHLVEVIKKTEDERQAVVALLAKTEDGIKDGMHMNDVWHQCKDKVQREQLRKLHQMLTKTVEEVQEMSANNEILIRSAMDAVRFKLNQLGGTVVEPSYGSHGQEQVSHSKNFDLEA